MSAGFTQGPWELSAAGAVWGISPWNARVCLANVTDFSPMNGIDSKANGRLIEAAPDMYAELSACMQFLEDMHTQSPDWTVGESQVRHAAIAAILAR